jgi:hypothetical protein
MVDVAEWHLQNTVEERDIGLPEPPIDACKEWQDQSFSLPPI